MSELSSETNPQILVNGKQEEQQEDDSSAAEERMSSISPDEECSEDSVAAEKRRQAKVQSVFKQVRNQIRSQAPKSSMVELVQKVKDREMEVAQGNGEPEDKEVSDEDDAVAADEQMSSISPDKDCSEDSVTAEKERQAKVQSVFKQVRNQIRSQAPKSSMMELVQKVKDREMETAQMSGEPEDKDVSDEDDAVAADDQRSSVSPGEDCSEDSVAAEKGRQAKVQSVFKQVRNQIRSQAPKSSMVELVQKVKDREMEIAQGSGEPEDKDVSDEDDAVAADEQMSSISPDKECSEDSIAAEKERQAKVRSVFKQVRNQIRSQAPKSSMVELVQKVKDREMEIAQGSGEPEDKDVSSEDDAVAADEQRSSVSPDEECSEDSVAAEKERQAKVQSVFKQVRNQIRSQAPKSSMVELVQKVKDREMETAQMSSEPEDKDVSSEERKQGEMLTGGSKDETDLKEEDLCAIFETKLEASKKALRNEFEMQVSQVRKEMQAYTDQALKDLEGKMRSRQPLSPQQPHPKEQQENKGADKRQKPAAAPQLVSRRGRLLTRTMTTIIPKTCAPVIIGPRAKSETLSYSKGEYSRPLMRDPVLSTPGNMPYQSHRPLLPPAFPPDHQRKRPVRPKAKLGS